ncbi:MAG: phosphoglycerate dehydrogenase [Anaerolineae bacterium]|nr:phosphoglycerate dehydrogenase [Anaerolineae bacterium]
MKPLDQCHVLVTPTSFGRFDSAQKTQLEAAVGRVTYNTTGKPYSSAQLQKLLVDVDGYIAGLDEIDAAALQAAPQLKVVARYGVGIDNVDLAAAEKLGIVVTNTPGANAASVAELTIALLLNLIRPIHTAAEQTRHGGWPRLKGMSLVGKTVGLIGLGAIGREVARRLVGFDCTVLAHDVVADGVFAQAHGVALVDSAELLTRSDIVSLHVPVLPSTEQMVNADFLSQMKSGAFLINTSRGELIDEPALVSALVDGHLSGAALDAFQHEPPGSDNPLLALPQVIPTPHMGAHSDGATTAMGHMSLAECLAVLSGSEPRYRVVSNQTNRNVS